VRFQSRNAGPKARGPPGGDWGSWQGCWEAVGTRKEEGLAGRARILGGKGKGIVALSSGGRKKGKR